MRKSLSLSNWLKRNVGVVAVLVALLVLWSLYSRFLNPYGNLYFPSISFTIQQSLAYSDEIIQGLQTTLSEIVVGYIIAVFIGVLAGILTVKSSTIRFTILPYAVYLYALPAAIIAPLFVVWAPSYFISAIIFIAWVSFFVVFINTITGFQSIDDEFYMLGQSYGATQRQLVTKIEFWEALPHISGGLKIAVQQSIVAAIVIEFIATTGGLGYLLVTSLELLRPGLLFGVVIFVMVFSVLFYRLVTTAIDIISPKPL